MSSGYLFQAAPKAVHTRTAKQQQLYRDKESETSNQHEQKEAPRLSLMSDRRVARGSTYAPSRRTQPLVGGPFRPIQPPAAAPLSAARSPPVTQAQHPLPRSSAGPAAAHAASSHASMVAPDLGGVEFLRVATPEPVAGRSHCTVQTDTYLEDLRRSKAPSHTFATQTDAELDHPTQALFVPRSSGDDAQTEVREGDLFDFEQEVQAVLGVLVEKSLAEALMEVAEESELAILERHRAEYAQARHVALANVQALEQRDERRKAERERRAAQEAERVSAEKAAAERRQAALLSKQLVQSLSSDVLQRVADAGYLQDPVRLEVERQFMPGLLRSTADKLQRYARACEVLDATLADALQEEAQRAAGALRSFDESETEARIAHQLALAEGREREAGPEPVSAVFARAARVGASEELSAHAALQLPSSSAPAPPPSPRARARVVVQGIMDERAAKRAAEEQYARNVLRIQCLARGRRDRKRATQLADKKRREAERAAMSPQELLESLASDLGLEVDESEEGLVVRSVLPAGSASQASLCVGDRLLSLDGESLHSAAQLSSDALKSRGLHPGSIVSVQVRRALDGRLETLQVEVSTNESGYDDQERIRQLRLDAELDPSPLPWLTPEDAEEALDKLPAPKLGATVSEPPSSLDTGARLSKLSADGAAARAGLKEGDAIVLLDGQRVQNHREFSAAIKEARAGDVLRVEILAPEALEQLNKGEEINLRSAPKLERVIELAAASKKQSVEQLRALRRIAGLPVFGEM